MTAPNRSARPRTRAPTRARPPVRDAHPHLAGRVAPACAAALAIACVVVAFQHGVAAALAVLYLASSLACLLLYGLDKRAARRGGPRIAEATLLAWGLAGGWPGALLGQRLWRHKTGKRSFRRRLRLSVAVNVALLVGWALAVRP